MDFPNDLKYAKSHEWAKLDAKGATVGITQFAVEQLRDLVFLDLPKAGQTVTAGEPFGEIESVKAVSDLVSPVSGKVAQVNTELADHLDTLATDPYKKGWMIKVELSGAAPSDLMDAKAYAQHCQSEHH